MQHSRTPDIDGVGDGRVEAVGGRLDLALGLGVTDLGAGSQAPISELGLEHLAHESGRARAVDHVAPFLTQGNPLLALLFAINNHQP